MHWALWHHARHADALAKGPVQAVEQRATAREHDAATRHIVGYLGWQVLKRALDELGHFANGPGDRLHHVGRAQHNGLQPPLLEVPALDVDLDLPAVGLQQGRASFNLDALGVAFPDDQTVPTPYIAHDGLVHGVAGDTHRASLHDVALGQNGYVRGAAADVHHHERLRTVNGQPCPERGRHRFLDQVDLARARRDCGLADGAALDRRSTGRHADQNARSAEAQDGFGAGDELAQHLLGSDEVGDDPVAHGADD